jgi:glycine cleavage system H protein
MSTPTNLLFSTTDEWVKVEGNIATIGISDYAQNSLSDIVYVEFKVSAGETIKKDATCVGVESVKAAADVNSPISGKVLELNEGLVDTYADLNTDPYGAAWMLKIELSNPAELSSLMDSQAYDKFCENRSH